MVPMVAGVHELHEHLGPVSLNRLHYRTPSLGGGLTEELPERGILEEGWTIVPP